MPLRRRYRTRGLFLLTTGVAALLGACQFLGVFGWVMRAAMISERYFSQNRSAALLPAAAMLGAAVVGTFFWRGRRFESVLAAVAISLSLLSPNLLAWYTWHVVGDHTANIGAGILMLAQPILAPTAGLAGWLVGWAVKAVLFEPQPPDSAAEDANRKRQGPLRSWQDPADPRG